MPCLRWKTIPPLWNNDVESVCQCIKKEDGFCKQSSCTEEKGVQSCEDEGHSKWYVWLIGGVALLVLSSVSSSLLRDGQPLGMYYAAVGWVLGVMWFISVTIWGVGRVWLYFLIASVVATFFPQAFVVICLCVFRIVE